MELLKEQLRLTETKVSKKALTACDTDLIVPDVKPDIIKILQVDGSAFITSKEMTDGSCKINGRVKYTVFYLPDNSENAIEAIHAEQDFSHKIDTFSDTSCMIDIACDVERIDFTLLNSRKLAIKTTISLPYAIMENKSLSLAQGIDYTSAEAIYAPVKTENLQVFEECSFTLRDCLELPSGRPCISQILKLDAKVVNPEIKAITGKAVLKGDLQLSALYLDCDGTLNTVAGEIPFTEIAEAFNLEEDAPCHADFHMGDFSFEPSFDAAGEATSVNFDVSVTAVISSYASCEMQALTDCFCPGAKADMIYENIAFENVISHANDNHTVKEIIAPPENAPEISSVYNLFAKPVIQSAAPANGMICIEGTLEVYASCITAAPQMPVYTFKRDIPLKLSLEASCSDGCSSCIADIAVTNISFNLNMANEIELRSSLAVSAKLIGKTELNVVSECSLSEAKNEAGIVIYFVQPGDSLWSIAKNYSVALCELSEINGLAENDTLDIGKKLIIPV